MVGTGCTTSNYRGSATRTGNSFRHVRLAVLSCVAGVAIPLTPTAASAGIIVQFVETQPVSDGTRYVYEAKLAPDTKIDGFANRPFESFFTINDFAGFVLMSDSAPGLNLWEFVVNSTLDAYNVNPPDDLAIENLTWRYVGTDPVPAGSTLGTFSAVSMFSGTKDGFAAGQARNVNDLIGQPVVVGRVESVDVPAMPTVPEPTGIALALAGVACLAGGRRRFGLGRTR